MFHRPTARLAAWTTVLAGALVWPAASFACSPATCTNAWFGPAVVGTVPANTPALPVYLPRKDHQLVEPLALVRSSTGEPVAYTLQAGSPAWLRLAAPLIAGEEYKLTMVVGCYDTNPDGASTPENETFSFVAGPAAPTPTAAGDLILAQPKLEPVKTWTAAGSCTVTVDGVSQTVQLQPHPSLLPWLGVASLELFAAGESWSQGKSGQFALAGQPLPELVDITTRTNWHIYAVCQELPLHASPGLEVGNPLLSALIQLPPGMAPLEISATASLSCDPPVVPPDADSGADSGCTAGRQAGPGSLVVLLAGLGGLAMLRRRWGWLGRQ